MSVRKRLAVWHTCILAVCLAAFVTTLYFYMYRHMLQEVDDSLTSWTKNVKNTMFQPDSGLIGEIGQPGKAAVLPIQDTIVEVYDRNGRALGLDSTRYLIISRANMKTALTGKALLTTIRMKLHSFRLYFYPVKDSSGDVGYVLVTGRSLHHVEATMGEFRKALSMTLLFTIIAAAAISWKVIGLSLSPVGDMTETALEIASSGRLNQRIKARNKRDEFGRLAEALNTMLWAVERTQISYRQFLADASHELRTPLTSISGNIDYLRKAADAPEIDRDEALRDMDRETKRMARLVNELLQLARADSGIGFEFREFSLDEVVDRAVSEINPDRLAPGAKPIRTSLQKINMSGDPEKIEQLCLILLDNALKYSDKGGVEVVLERAGNKAYLAVSDAGIGIPAEDLPKIFDRFYRASNARKTEGFGLGLAIAKWIVDAHHGTIRAENRPGGGARFVVEFAVN